MKEVVKQESKNVAVYSEQDLSQWGQSEISSQDIVIPKLLLMQGLSNLVSEGKAKLGDIVDSVSGEILGNIEKGVDIVPFLMKKIWIIQKYNGRKYEFDRVEDLNHQNENLPWEFEEGGNKYKRVYTRNIYCLIGDRPLPYMVSFASTSAKAGKELATLMYSSNAIQKLPPCGHHVTLGCRIDKNDDGTYAVKTVRTGEKSTKEEVEKAYQWFMTLSNKPTTVAEFGDIDGN